MVIPYVLRNEMIERIHDGHMGIDKCRKRTNQPIWWPGMGKKIDNRLTKCRHCLTKKPTQPSEPLMSTELPSQPFMQVASDLFELKKTALLTYRRLL